MRGRRVTGKRKGNKNTGNKWLVKNRQGEVNNSIGNREVKELICMTHGHELRGGVMYVEVGCRVEGKKGKKNGTTIIA